MVRNHHQLLVPRRRLKVRPQIPRHLLRVRLPTPIRRLDSLQVRIHLTSRRFRPFHDITTYGIREFFFVINRKCSFIRDRNSSPDSLSE